MRCSDAAHLSHLDPIDKPQPGPIATLSASHPAACCVPARLRRFLSSSFHGGRFRAASAAPSSRAAPAEPTNHAL
ncbi:hypothetical protein CALVIDRAFT_536339 [Calocera viscosa TUFC12733]|uniref:Uncharacterized protein n=1 Tax=Calocera viscosa (strain TUFC12733) TaxID=1330018 RepID=A0A167N3Z8_CALVF|nr:hypothetical protein CALVIDRAFT_536339 [Calocera viscosa TUFC12733]